MVVFLKSALFWSVFLYSCGQVCVLVRMLEKQRRGSLWFKFGMNSGQEPQGIDRLFPLSALKIMVVLPKQAVISFWQELPAREKSLQEHFWVKGRYIGTINQMKTIDKSILDP